MENNSNYVGFVIAEVKFVLLIRCEHAGGVLNSFILQQPMRRQQIFKINWQRSNWTSTCGSVHTDTTLTKMISIQTNTPEQGESHDHSNTQGSCKQEADKNNMAEKNDALHRIQLQANRKRK